MVNIFICTYLYLSSAMQETICRGKFFAGPFHACLWLMPNPLGPAKIKFLFYSGKLQCSFLDSWEFLSGEPSKT